MSGLAILLICLMGLCWGSFLNVLIVRTISGESIMFPPSKCPKCDVLIRWFHNIPIFSYFHLKGRCAYCNKTISPQYPIVELLGLGIFLFAFLKNVSKVDAVCVILILSMFLVISFTDVKNQKISTVQSYIIMAAALCFNRHDLINSLLGGLIGAGFISAIMLTGLKLFKKETFGVGDIYLIGALGMTVGVDKLLYFLAYTLFIQFLLILPNYILGLIKNSQLQTLKYLIFFWLSCIFLYFFKNITFWGSKCVLVSILAATLFCSYKLIKNIIISLKTSETSSVCPFAPAIALSCLIFLC